MEMLAAFLLLIGRAVSISILSASDEVNDAATHHPHVFDNRRFSVPSKSLVCIRHLNRFAADAALLQGFSSLTRPVNAHEHFLEDQEVELAFIVVPSSGV